jgi:hypothetical protein
MYFCASQDYRVLPAGLNGGKETYESVPPDVSMINHRVISAHFLENGIFERRQTCCIVL